MLRFISWFLGQLLLLFPDCFGTIHLSVCSLNICVVCFWSSPCSSANQESLSRVSHVTWQPGLLQMQLEMSTCAVEACEHTGELCVCVQETLVCPHVPTPTPAFRAVAREVTHWWTVSVVFLPPSGLLSSSGWWCCNEAWFPTLIIALIQAWPSDHSSFKLFSFCSPFGPLSPLFPTSAPWCGQNS